MNSAAASIFLRPMAEADVDRVLEIAASLPSAPHWPREAWLETLNPGAALRRVALVAVPSQIAPVDRAVPSIVGFAVASLLPPQAELEGIAVVQDHQRLGLGRRLLLGLIDHLRQAGIGELLLEVRASNLAAIGLYRSSGFIQRGARAAYYADPVEDAVLMNLQLQ